MSKRAWLLLWAPAVGLFAASCGSDSTGSPGGAGGDAAASGGEAEAGVGSGATSASGGTGSQGGALTTTGGTSGSAGSLAGMGAEPAGGAGEVAGAPGGGGEAAGGMEATGGAPPLVADATCLEHEDCLAVCNANGWPQAHCFGSSERYCSCESSGEPTCTSGTTEGCPTGTACRSAHQCIPYGDGVQGDPCDEGDECSPGFICVGFGNPLPNGESTACSRMCDAQSAPPGCDCTAGYCLGGLGLFDLECAYPNGTPCSRTVAANDTRVAKITGPGEIEPGYVYLVTLTASSGQNVDLEVCGSPECAGDNVCVSKGPGDSESCLLQAGDDELFVHMLNRGSSSASVTVDVATDTMSIFPLEHTQVQSSLNADAYARFLVTGLTPGTSYDFEVTTNNARDINLVISNDLHGQQELCDEALAGTSASCRLTVTQSSVWALLTDTSGIGDAYTFKVTAP